jgi:hypothetical protein
MKTKRLTKKIQRLEARLQKGAKKLASLKQKLRASEAKTKRKRAAQARESLIPVRVAALQKNSRRLTAKTAPKPASGRISFKEVKKKRQITPERRAQLSAAMKARWAAKRAAAAAPQNNSPDQGATPGETAQQ